MGHTPISRVIFPLVAYLPFSLWFFFSPWSGWEYKLYNYKICVVIEMWFGAYNLPSCVLPELLFATIYGFWMVGNLEWILKFDSNFRKPVFTVKPLPPSEFLLLISQIQSWDILLPVQRTQLRSCKKTWWHMTLWYTQLHMFGCPQGGPWNVWQSCTCF